MNEKQVEAQIKTFIRANGGWVVKLHADAIQGRETLDLIGSFQNRPFLIEVKRKTGKASKLQNFLVARAIKTGYVSGIVESVEDFKNLYAT